MILEHDTIEQVSALRQATGRERVDLEPRGPRRLSID